MPPAPAQLPPASRWKGKARDLSARDDGQSGTGGIVVDLQLIEDSLYQSVYVAPIFLGSALNKFYVQVDTGSSDLWLASTSCASSLCSQAGQRYDPSQSTPTGISLSLQYAEGETDGPVVWDSVQLGGYNVQNQALIAANDVNNEPLSSNFDGVMGLALPLNSVIAEHLHPTTSNQPDGAPLSSNLFGITPLPTAPGQRFFSLALERPGSDKVPSVLGIGSHPQSLVPDPAKVQYATVVSTGSGALWWQATVHAINVYVDGVAKPISLPLSVTGSGTPSAILDSGVPLIITTPAIANGIYGAIGISPASDGNYYLSCTTPLNISIQLDDRMDIPLHPLDLSTYPPNGASSDDCIGLIQTTSQFPGFTLDVADMILGVPFLRNTYTVMAYDPPFPNGSFPANSLDDDEVESISPRLGLMNLTNPATAAAEFHQVRVLKQPLGTVNHSPSTGGKGLSVGIEVLIGLLGFFGLCFVLFGARWAFVRRKYKRANAVAGPYEGNLKDSSYVLNTLGYHRAGHSSEPSEDELRHQRFEEYKRRQMDSSYTDDTITTHVEDAGAKVPDEFGAIKVPETPLQDYFDSWGDTLVNSPPAHPLENVDELLSPLPRTARRSDYSPRSMHHRTLSGPGVDVPLLGHGRSESNPRDADVTEFGMESPQSMAGIGTVNRSRRFSSMTGSSIPSAGEENPPRVPSHAHTTSGSPPHIPAPVTMPARVLGLGSEPVLDVSRNESRVSELGHGT